MRLPFCPHPCPKSGSLIVQCLDSENTLIGATNDETGRVNSAIDFSTGDEGTIPEVAKAYKARGQPWMIVTDVSQKSCSTSAGRG